MRADAQRNAEKLRAAAAEVFRERGLQAPLKEIARRAGVSHGTLYNLFGTREALIDEVVVDLASALLDEVAEQALAHEDAWEGFSYYIRRVCELEATDRIIGDVVLGRYPGADRLMGVCDRAKAAAARVIRRAHEAGALRPDFTDEDLVFVFGSSGRIARAAGPTAPDVWRRGVAFMLDGLRTEAAHPLPAAPLTRQQTRQVVQDLTGTP